MSEPTNPDRQTLESACKDALIAVGVCTVFIGFLSLDVPLFTLQIFDRVMTSQSSDTLVLLSVGVVFVLVMTSALQLIRSRLLVRLSARIDNIPGQPLLKSLLRQKAMSGLGGAARPMRDANVLRVFLTGPRLFTLLDLPWVPLYLGLILIFHPILGLIAFAGGGILVLLAFLSDRFAKPAIKQADHLIREGLNREDIYTRNAEMIEASGMSDAVLSRWQAFQLETHWWESRGSELTANVVTVSRLTRQVMHIGLIAVGAYLTILGEITTGVMVASMILGARALAPLDSAVTTWRSLSLAREAYGRLQEVLLSPEKRHELPLTKNLNGGMKIENLVFGYAGSRQPILKGFSFEIAAGQLLGITGPVAAGKSTLLKCLIGIWAPFSGSVRLDDLEVSHYRRSDLGRQIGYLPQSAELLPGTIAENIAGFTISDPEEVSAAATLAGIHEDILNLSDGYQTKVIGAGENLSGGQRQMIAIARALYGSPKLVVLDEPASMLDADIVEHVITLIERLRQNGITTVVVSHNPFILKRLDAVMILKAGLIEDIRPVKKTATFQVNVAENAAGTHGGDDAA